MQNVNSQNTEEILNQEQSESQSLQDSNKQLMNTIRKYPAIYDKSCPEYKNQRVKSNAWLAVSKSLGMDVSLVQKRYNTIRSNFSKYLKDLKGKSGCGRGDIEIRPDLEYLRWLITHIKHRQTSSNIKLPCPELLSPVTTVADIDGNEQLVDTDTSGAELSASINGENSVGSPDGSVVSAASSVDNKKGQDIQSFNKRKRGQSEETAGNRPWAKSRGFESEVVKTMQGINASLLHLSDLTTPENENKGNANEDEDSLFCLSLVPKFKRIPTLLKSTLQMNILKTINDMEVLVQQQMRQENMVHQITPQQQYGHAGFQIQTQWLQQQNNNPQNID